MTSILKVDNLQDASGTGAPYIKGHVLNVLQGTSTTESSAITSGNSADAVSKAITPSSTSSKILVRCAVAISGGGNSYGHGILYRGSTAIGIGTNATGSQTNASFMFEGNNYTYGSYRMHTHYFEFLDSPNTTSATTYKITVTSTSDTLYINRPHTDGGDSAIVVSPMSTITLMEIGG
tara:strand:+ start:13 stop:546 length:534 start_codon:yes stop_codon:yes gene_type:complete